MARVAPSMPSNSPTRLAAEAMALAARLPRLALEARRISATVAVGLHGKRRAGLGENFWQYRAFSAGEAANRIDWRRSARHEGAYFVREREWEAAHTVHLWIDRSGSMNFGSSLAPVTKSDRAMVLGLALAELLVRGGERVALMGLTQPLATRGIIDRFIEALTPARGSDANQPPIEALPRLSEAVLITDALLRLPEFEAARKSLGASGARGHVLRLIDPVEESFPFEGEAELTGVETDETLVIGDAGAFRASYRAAMALHDAGLREICAKHGWSYLSHHTDRPASEALLALNSRIAAQSQSGPRPDMSFR